jgi:hypothetical protein
VAFFVLLVIVILAVKGLSEPFFGLLALLTVYVVEPGELYPSLAVFHLERTLAILVLVSFLMHGNKLRFPSLTKKFLAFFGAMVASIPLAFWPMNTVEWCITFFSTVVYHMLIVSLLTDEERVRKYIVLSVGLTGWLAGSSFFQYASGVREVRMGIERATGLTSSGGDANTLGITLVTTMPFEFLMMAKGNPKWMRVLGLAIFGLSLAVVIETGSRTSFFSFLLFLALLIFLNPKNLKFLPALFLLLPLLWLVIPEQYKKRYETVDDLKDDDSFQNRRLSWQGGERMFMHNPLTGVGANNYTAANGSKYWPEEPKHWLNAHSLYFMVMGELGSLGIFTFGTYVVSLILLNRKLSKDLKARGASVFLQRYPAACNLNIFLLLFTGYSAHNLYRSSWYMMGAISASVALIKHPESSSESGQEGQTDVAKPHWLPWDPKAAEPPEASTPIQV